MSPPADQVDCNSCWAISVSQAISDRLRSRGTINPNDELNYYALHDWAIQFTDMEDGCRYGAIFDTGMDWSIEKGIPLMSESRDRAFDDRPVKGDMDGRLFQISDWYEDHISNGKKILETDGSFVVNINLYDSFDNFNGSGIYRPMAGEQADPHMVHMVTVVGYNDNDQTWIIRNSYGSRWGHGGLVKIPMHGTDLIDQGKIFYPRF